MKLIPKVCSVVYILMYIHNVCIKQQQFVSLLDVYFSDLHVYVLL
jgi:hypothetical protein